MRETHKWRLILLLFWFVGRHSQKLFFPPISQQVYLFKVCIILISLFYLTPKARTIKNTQKEGTGKKLDSTYRRTHLKPGLLVCDHIIYHLNRKIWEIILHSINKTTGMKKDWCWTILDDVVIWTKGWVGNSYYLRPKLFTFSKASIKCQGGIEKQ